MADYITENIRHLLLHGFDSRELWDHCFDHADFQQVLLQVRANPSSAELVSALLSFARQQHKFDELLDMAQRLNPAAFEEHGPYKRVHQNSQKGSASQHYTAVRPTDSNRAHTFRLRAAMMARDGKWAEAIQLLEIALEIDPTNQGVVEDLRQARNESEIVQERQRWEEQQRADSEAARVERCRQLWASLSKARARGAWATVEEIQRRLRVLGCR